MEKKLIEVSNDGEYKILLDPNYGKFHILELEENEWVEHSQKDTLEEANQFIESREKRKEVIKKKKIEPMEVLRRQSYQSDDYVVAKITSLAEPSRYNKEGDNVWIMVGGKRSKESTNYGLYEKTESNIKIFEEIKALNKKVSELKDSLVEIKKEDIIKHFS